VASPPMGVADARDQAHYRGVSQPLPERETTPEGRRCVA
jgi:hypothetical protein